MKSVEREEELLLCPFFAGKEMYVVDKKDIYVPVSVLEFVRRAVSDSLDEFIDEILGRDIADPHPRMLAQHVMTYCLDKMCLSQAGASIDEKRIVGLPGHLGDGKGGRLGEPVAVSYDEFIESVSVV